MKKNTENIKSKILITKFCEYTKEEDEDFDDTNYMKILINNGNDYYYIVKIDDDSINYVNAIGQIPKNKEYL